MVGGLLIGLLARFGPEKIRGHGIPEAMEAILIGRSRMSAKVALLKPLASAVSIGTGGPFGAEGPIIMTGAFGSLFAQAFHLSAAERKTLLVAGAAAGMAAIFATSPVVTYPDELLEEAVGKMVRHDRGRLPVVDRSDPGRLLGYLGRTGIAAGWRQVSEEERRDGGWLSRKSRHPA